ncbi:MAG TPA: hypothetical protein VNQ90_01590 [Chthoniobacteraceae bacterium]|nr:hypothetical protein [Chthoniobacteraceae bacterium]
MSKFHPVSAPKASMNFLMFMALLFVGWNPSPLRDLAAAVEAGTARVAEPVPDAGRPDENRKAATDPSHSSRSFAFSTPTREWLRTSSNDTPPEHFLLPGSLAVPVVIFAPCFESVGRAVLPVPGRRVLAHSNRAPPAAIG